jgi:hypothetical protein
MWVYHCMTPTIGNHVSKGMFGLVVGTYMLEDHHISRLEKGAFAHLRVDGAD